MGVLTAVAEFERDLLIERTHAGIVRARAEGKTMGRPPALTRLQQTEALQRLAAGESVSQLARDYRTTGQPSCGFAQRQRRRNVTSTWDVRHRRMK
jgi:putative DNA-invertase from lambdoid prophage Rac